jgi:hypothetical protein
LRAESSTSSEAPELLRQLAADRAQAEEQQAHLTSELQALRQQLLQVQQAATKAEGAAKADSSAALHAQKQLLLQDKQHKAEVRADVIWALLGGAGGDISIILHFASRLIVQERQVCLGAKTPPPGKLRKGVTYRRNAAERTTLWARC